MSESHIRYRLQGESLAAAKIAQAFMRQNPSASESAFIAAYPSEAATLGLDFATLQTGDCGGRLRSYLTFPTLYRANDRHFYLDCPIAHDGTHFAPAGAARLSAEEEKKSHTHFYAGLGEGISPLLHIQPEGAASPDTATHLSTAVDYGGRSLPINAWYANETHVYFATPEMLAELKAFEKEDAAFKEAVAALTDAVSDIIKTLVPKMQARQKKKEVIRPSIHFDKAEKCLNVRIDNAYLPDHPALDIKDTKSHNHLVFKVRPNLRSTAGRRLAKLFNAVGEKQTSLASKLGLPEHAYPRFMSVGDAFRLVTNLPTNTFIADPNKNWFLRDKEDDDYKTKKPPRPF